MALPSSVAVYRFSSLFPCSSGPGNERARRAGGQVASNIAKGSIAAKQCNETVAYVTPFMAKLTGHQQVREFKGRWVSPASCHMGDSSRRGRSGHQPGATASQLPAASSQLATEMQFEHHVTLEVAAPPDIVWNLWVDLKSAPHWMRWIQRVEIIEENEPSSPPLATEGRVSAPKDLPAAAPPPGEGAEATMVEMESAATETLHSEEQSRGDALAATEQETSLGKEANEGRREERAEAVLRRKEGERSEVRQSGEEEAGEEGVVKKEPRLNSLSRWVCNTAGFEVSWTARIECVEAQPPVRVLRWATVQGLQSKGEVRFTEAVGCGTCVELKPQLQPQIASGRGADSVQIEHSLPPALARVMSQHALSTLIEATLKSDLERFEEYALSTASAKA